MTVMRRGAVVVGMALAVWSLAGCGMMHHGGMTGAAKVVRAEQIVLVSPDGKEQCVLKATADGPSIVLMDTEGKERMLVGAVRFEELGGQQAWGVTLLDEAGVKRAALGLYGDAGLGLWDPKGQVRLGIGVSENGIDAGLTMAGADGKLVLTMGTGEGGTGISLKGPNGVDRLGVSMIPNGASAFVISNAEGQETWRAP